MIQVVMNTWGCVAMIIHSERWRSPIRELVALASAGTQSTSVLVYCRTYNDADNRFKQLYLRLPPVADGCNVVDLTNHL